jgi:hypothetical protein
LEEGEEVFVRVEKVRRAAGVGQRVKAESAREQAGDLADSIVDRDDEGVRERINMMAQGLLYLKFSLDIVDVERR